jgi:hypothetical protein
MVQTSSLSKESRGLPVLLGKLICAQCNGSADNSEVRHDGMMKSITAAALFIFLALSTLAQGPEKINVMALGAKGDGVTDDTAAIQAAINQAYKAGGCVFFPPPPKFYKVMQPQLPSTAPVFTIPPRGSVCIEGSAAHYLQGLPQFPFAPMDGIVVSPGPNPNAAAVFAAPTGTTFENISIGGYNQAVSLFGAVQVKFKNVCLSVPATTRMHDNTPLKITNSFWIWYEGGCLMAIGGNETVPIVLFTGETSQHGEAPLDGLITMENIIAAGGGMRYVMRTNQWGTSGNFVFRNITIEDTQTDLFGFYAENGGKFGALQSFTFDHVTSSDSAKVSVVSTNDPSVKVSGLFMNQSYAYGPTIATRQGTVTGYFDTQTNSFDALHGTILYLGSLTVDATGVSFGSGKISQSSPNSLDISLPMYAAPTNVAAIATVGGGTVAAGTHTYVVVAANDGASHLYSLQSQPVTVTLSAPGHVVINWTPAKGMLAPGGYDVIRDGAFGGSWWVPGLATTTFTDSGQAGCCWDARFWQNVPAMVPVLHVTPQGLFVNGKQVVTTP